MLSDGLPPCADKAASLGPHPAPRGQLLGDVLGTEHEAAAEVVGAAHRARLAAAAVAARFADHVAFAALRDGDVLLELGFAIR